MASYIRRGMVNYSYDGERVVYLTDYSLIAGDLNGLPDIYIESLYDGLYPDPSGTPLLVSVSTTGGQHGVSNVSSPTFSPDGTKVVFAISTGNFSSADTNGRADIYLRDLITNTTTQLSVEADGSQLIYNSSGAGAANPVFSPDGTMVMFMAREHNLDQPQIYIKHLTANTLKVASTNASDFIGNLDSDHPSWAPNSQQVVFDSRADNLVLDDRNYGPRDIFIKNVQSGKIELISRTSGAVKEPANGDSERPVWAANANKIVYISAATDLIQNDTNGTKDAFLYDVSGKTTTRVSVKADGTQSNGTTWDAVISPDGTKVVFVSNATDLVAGSDLNNGDDIFLKDLVTGKVTLLSTEGNEPGETSRFPRFSADGGVIMWQTRIDYGSDTIEEMFTYVIPGPINGTSGNDTKTGTPRPDTINGLGGNDTLIGKGANDLLDGGTGKDTMQGGKRDDTYVVDNAKDVVDEQPAGSNGIDTVKSSIDFNLAGAQVKGDVENLTLTGSSDLDGTGNGLGNVLTGNSGDNKLAGAGGKDTVKGGAGKDEIDGGNGKDTADYSDKASAITVKLAGSADADVKVGTVVEDTVKNVENVIGTKKNDKITGDGLANILDGGKGKDALDGAGGKDVLNGGAGKDSLTGGAAADKFVFNTALATAGVDTIKDFVHGTDKIQLEDSIFFGIGPTLTPDEFVIGTAAGDLGDRIIYDPTTGKLSYDADGTQSGGVAAIQFAILSSKPVLDDTDIVMI
jgi:Ca2+-binding RTX toxin-like protein